MVFAAELLVIVAVRNVLALLGLSQLVLPAIAVVVGVHFLPLAALFGASIYYVSGITLIAVGCVGLAGILASRSSTVWIAGVTFAAAMVLWTTAAVILREAHRALSGR